MDERFFKLKTFQAAYYLQKIAKEKELGKWRNKYHNFNAFQKLLKYLQIELKLKTYALHNLHRHQLLSCYLGS
jgi:hypothetical protein